MDRLAATLLKHRALVLAGWALLCVIGGIFAAGLPGRIVSGGEAPASSQSEVVARELADTPLLALFVAVRVPPDATPADQAHATSAVALAVHRVRGVTAVSPLPDVLPA
ncbi:MAG: hypothetical protein QOF95_633, partial [Pseudonocardiales bacterium]|nr:hypothetical protein [Pseudonocardiales bacterium]